MQMIVLACRCLATILCGSDADSIESISALQFLLKPPSLHHIKEGVQPSEVS